MTSPRTGKEHLAQIGLGLLALFLAAWGITSWRYSFVGDEYAYFDMAKEIARHKLLMNPFSLQGVYGLERLMVSFPQGLMMALLGPCNAAWRMTNALLAFPTVYFLYSALRVLFGPRQALTGGLLMASSFYFMNFAKNGYTHPFAALMMVLVLYFCARALNEPRHLLSVAVVLGLSFYTYIGPVYPVMFSPFLFVALRNQPHRFKSALACLGVYGFIVSLGYMTSPRETWMGGLKKTTVFGGEISQDLIPSMLINIGNYFLVFFRNSDYFYNHFVAGPYLDVLGRGALVLGCLVGLRRLSQPAARKHYLLGILFFMTTQVTLGIINPYSYTPSTRGVFSLIPAFVVGSWVIELVKPRWLQAAAALGLITSNLYWGQAGLWRITGHHHIALIVREAQKHPGVIYSIERHSDFEAYRALLSSLYHFEADAVSKGDIEEVCRSRAFALVFTEPGEAAETRERLATCRGSGDFLVVAENYY